MTVNVFRITLSTDILRGRCKVFTEMHSRVILGHDAEVYMNNILRKSPLHLIMCSFTFPRNTKKQTNKILLLLLSLLAERKEHVITRTYHVTFSEHTIHENQQLNERLVLRDVNQGLMLC